MRTVWGVYLLRFLAVRQCYHFILFEKIDVTSKFCKSLLKAENVAQFGTTQLNL